MMLPGRPSLDLPGLFGSRRRPVRSKRVLTGVWLLLGAMAWPLSAGNAEQALTESKLKALRAEIAAASSELAKTQSSRDQQLTALRTLDEAQALIARASQARRTESESLNQLRQQIGTQKTALSKQVDQQRQRLTGLVRQAYASGRSESLRALLDRDGSDLRLRQLGYLRVLKRERQRRIQQLLADTRRLDSLQDASRAADKAYAIASRLDQLMQAELGSQRSRHDAEVASLMQRLNAQKQALGSLAKDEQALLQLLERLTDILADVRTDLAKQQAPVRQQRGRLPWPVSGKILQRFGVQLAPGRVSDGVLIEAKTGTPVQAVAHGRVAFADWLKGYGLVLILDHGDGVMSLYAQNESLSREVGDWVQTGDVLAQVGQSGGNAVPGLYFEVRVSSRPDNPLLWLARN
ncbi:hypothetical protein C7S18_22040 [Ahniella affigens]|uniref:M23ase beta-sheet core domain-containing protein n=1 Tax=Ahniella affigens TaxID=2021234 RepID=A0A2P1PXW8_9GAMM|nr:peptidoglycan DD-metalloendopeptidase family protein [Ahniella affigens]AVP99688.1 hypothetical protein C7S18_22040 [Ahniella affigens]